MSINEVSAACKSESERGSFCVVLDRSRQDLHTINEINLKYIHSFKDVCSLDLSHNYLKAIPGEIIQLPMLEHLNLSNNNINDMGNIGWDKLKILSTVDLSCNEIGVISEKLMECKSLNCLNFSRNNLRSIPFAIKELENLFELYLRNNELEMLPDDFYQLTSLKILDLSSNRLKSISPKIAQFKKLTKLDLSFNLISEIPREVICLCELESLNVAYNPLANPPLDICALGVMHIFRYFAKAGTDSQVQSNQLSFVKAKAANVAKYIFKKSSTTAPTSDNVHRYAVLGGPKLFDQKLFEKFMQWKKDNDYELNTAKHLYENHFALCHNASIAIKNVVGKQYPEEVIIHRLLDGCIVNEFLSQMVASTHKKLQITNRSEVAGQPVYIPSITKRWSDFLTRSQQILGSECPFNDDDIVAISKNPLNHIDIILDVIHLIYKLK